MARYGEKIERIMKSVEDSLLQRRSIRRYTRDKIEPEKLNFIYDAIRSAPTSYNGQQFSVIAVNDQNTKDEIYQITGQKQIKTCATLLVFCLDFHKLSVAAKLKNEDPTTFERTMNGYTVGVIDASLAMMNAVTAAQALDLGCCCIGYVRTADPFKISQILALPKGVAIVCGLSIGYPNEMPDLKPKMPRELVIHQERYTPDYKMEKPLTDYDNQVQEFNQSRNGATSDNDWTRHILSYHHHSTEMDIKEYLTQQILLGE